VNPKEVKDTTGRAENSTIVWHESEEGKLALLSYVVKTKSKGTKNILALGTVPDLATMGITIERMVN
jgi:hypothetical protein